MMEVRLLSIEEIERLGQEARKTGNEPVFQMANELKQVRSRVRSGEIVAESLVSAKDSRGRVRVSWHDEEAFLDLEIATGLGQAIIEAACAARIDESLVNVLRNDVGLKADEVSTVLRAVREARQRIDGGRAM